MASERSLRIALVHTSDFGGGAEASTVSLQKALQNLGHDCHLYVGTKHSDANDITEIERYRPFPGVLRVARFLEQRFGWQYLYHPWFRNLDRLFDEPVDVIHFQSLWSGMLGYADVGGLPKLTNRYPSLLTLRDLWMLTGHCAYPAIGCERWRIGCGKCPDLKLAPAIPKDGTRFNWKRKQRAIRKSKLTVTAVSDWMARTTRESPIFEGKDVRTVHNGIDEATFYPHDQRQARAELGLPQGAFIVLVAGQSVEGTTSGGNGAVDYAIEALRGAAGNPFVLAIGHSGEQFLDRWGGDGKAIPFLRDPSHLSKHYSAADVVLVASLWETFGRIPAEAQMSGSAVVSFATGGIPEIVDHEESGMLAETGNSAELGSCLERLQCDSALRNSIREKAARNAKNRFSNFAIAKKYESLYFEIISARNERF